jgi:hypothetical protein
MDEHDSKTDLAVRACLEQAIPASNPYAKAGEFFAALKADSRFTEAEVAEIQTRVLNRLTSENRAD